MLKMLDLEWYRKLQKRWNTDLNEPCHPESSRPARGQNMKRKKWKIVSEEFCLHVTAAHISQF